MVKARQLRRLTEIKKGLTEPDSTLTLDGETGGELKFYDPSPFPLLRFLHNCSVDIVFSFVFACSVHKVTIISTLIFPKLAKVCLFLHSIW